MTVEELARLYSFIKEAEEDSMFEDVDDLMLFDELDIDEADEIDEILDYADALEKTAALYKMAAKRRAASSMKKFWRRKLKPFLKKYWPWLAVAGGGTAGTAALLTAMKKRQRGR